LRLAVRTQAHLEMLLLLLFTLQADGDLLDPSVLGKWLLAFDANCESIESLISVSRI
jgi:hypothetical protein